MDGGYFGISLCKRKSGYAIKHMYRHTLIQGHITHRHACPGTHMQIKLAKSGMHLSMKALQLSLCLSPSCIILCRSHLKSTLECFLLRVRSTILKGIAVCCVCRGVLVHVCARVFVCIWRPEINPGCCSSRASHLFSKETSNFSFLYMWTVWVL